MDALRRRQVLTLAQTAGCGSLCAWAAQATGEVERSEGEGRGAAPPSGGLGDLPASWRACSWGSVVLWVTWRRVRTAGWYGGAGACEERAVEAPAGVTRKLAGDTAGGVSASPAPGAGRGAAAKRCRGVWGAGPLQWGEFERGIPLSCCRPGRALFIPYNRKL